MRFLRCFGFLLVLNSCLGSGWATDQSRQRGGGGLPGDRVSENQRRTTVPVFTAYPNFQKACTAVVVDHAPRRGLGSRRFPVLGHYQGVCTRGRPPLLFTVAHENHRNSHVGAANYDSEIAAYMGDFDYKADLGTWVDWALSAEGILSLKLNTIDFHKLNVTGWPLQYGHLFVALNDLSVEAALDQPVTVEFDIRILLSEVRSDLYDKYSGRRIMVGAVGTWIETPPRQNKSHFLEVDLVQSPGYPESYGDPAYELCKDAAYDRCYYSIQGRYPEGREIPITNESTIPVNSTKWTHVRIALSAAFHRLGWVSPPKSWAEASIEGLYIGIESEGATKTTMEIRNYKVYGGRQ